MPNPKNVHYKKSFERESDMKAYADGLWNGACFLSQGHGSDPFNVRTECDPLSQLYSAYLERGNYNDDGSITWF